MDYQIKDNRLAVLDWANKQLTRGVSTRRIIVRLRELATTAEEEGQLAGADWLRSIAARADEPRLYPLTYVKPWAVLTHYSGKRFKRKFGDKVTAHKRMKAILKRYPGASVYLVNVYRPQEKPSDLQLHPGHLYCPWCGTGRRFKNDGYGYLRCPICRISTENFYTRRANFNRETVVSDSKASRKEMRRRKKESRRRVHGTT